MDENANKTGVMGYGRVDMKKKPRKSGKWQELKTEEMMKEMTGHIKKVENIIQKRVADLIPYARNSRTHSPEQILKLRSSIREFGFTNPILIDDKDNIIAGHGRVLAARAEGFEEVPCIILDYLTAAQRKAYVIADNRLALDAGWDSELLALELGELKDEFSFDLSLTGFDEDEISAMFDTANIVVEDDFDLEEELTDDPPLTQKGDIWMLGRHRVLCGDATVSTDVSILMEGSIANLVVIDPPYNVNYHAHAKDGRTIVNDNMSDGDFHQFLLSVYQNLYAITEDGGGIYVFHADSEGHNFRSALVEAGWKLAQCCIWVKNAMVMGRQDYHWQHEPILYGWKPTGSHKWYSDRKQTSLWRFDRPTKSKEHPTMKPVNLVAYPITNNTQSNAIVVDFFGGSGSTLIACEQTNRINYSMEIDPKYCDVIARRYIKFTQDSAGVQLRRNGEPVDTSFLKTIQR
jgi:DNA modification methylase